MAIDPGLQRQGIGRLCMAEAAGAGEFYAECGFREVGRVVYRKTPLAYYELVL